MNAHHPSQRTGSVQGNGGSAYDSTDYPEALRIRARMIGVLLRDARENAGRSVEDCAAVLRVSPELFAAWEYGDETPSLPQLEIAAYYLGVPVSHFWSTSTLESERVEHDESAQDQYQLIRNRMVGVQLRLAREALHLSLEELSETVGLPTSLLEQYELGELPVPMGELSALASALKKTMRYFLESSSYIGDFLTMREEWQHFTALPEDLRKFAANPLHGGFLEIALMLSQMPTDRLRRVGESILNITM
jgi:transcriptional regulator with XRE-family HTH domain